MHERIGLHPSVCHGKPVIKGSCVLVGTVLGVLAWGDSIEAIHENCSNITREDIVAALALASELTEFEDVPYGLEPA